MNRLLLFTFCLLGLVSLAAQGTPEIVVPETQIALVTKRTATWCTICGGSAWDLQKRLTEELGEDALVINGHYDQFSRLYSPTADTIIENFGSFFGQPLFFVNEERIGNGSGETESIIRERVAAGAQTSPVAQTGLWLEWMTAPQMLKVKSKTRFFQSGEGTYRLGLYFIRQNIVEEQASRGPAANHTNVLLYELTGNTFGQLLTPVGAPAGAEFEIETMRSFDEDLNELAIYIAAIIWKENQDGSYDLVNVAFSEELEQSPVVHTTEASGLPGRFGLLPNPITDGASLRLQATLDQPLRDARWTLLDASGRIVQIGRLGTIPTGEHQWLLPLRQDLASGIYVFQLRMREGQWLHQLVK